MLKWLGFMLGTDLLVERVDGFGAERERRYFMSEFAYEWRRNANWLSKVQARVDFSYGEFVSEQAEEYLIAGGVFARWHPMFGTTIEYVRWEFEGENVVNRIEWIAHAYF